jgi:hypothetical protein
MVKVVVNRCYGGFGLSKKAYDEIGLKWDGYGYHYSEDFKRTDPTLVAIVEKLGEEASGLLSKLVVVEVPDDVDWEIDEYDGMERVRERSREW